MTMVKVCGITSVDDAENVVVAGADAIGLNFVHHSPRAITTDQAARISKRVRGKALRVGVFENAPIETVKQICEQCELDVVQLHGNEDPAYVTAMDLPVIKALPADTHIVDKAAQYPGVDILLDHKSGGGSGKAWNYQSAEALVGRGRRIWLAGGLGPDNVKQAIEQAGPIGVDASSRLESTQGKKDKHLVEMFIEAIHQADHELGNGQEEGFFSSFGGRFVPETLFYALEELTIAYQALKHQRDYWAELDHQLSHYVGRPTPLYFCERVSADLGLRVFLKREDLAHTGAHKINNALGQVLLARHMGKKRIIAETGAGQHGVATATACARYGIPCEIYMGKQDTERQKLNVFRMRLLGAKVNAVESGSQTLKDAMNEAMRDWATNVRSTYYLIGSTAGPHPYPSLVRDLQAVIGREAKQQIRDAIGTLPDVLVACVGGGSNALGLFHEFRNEPNIRMVGVEAGGSGIGSGRHGAAISAGTPGVLHGSRSYVLQDENGQIAEAHSLSAGLDYPGVGPEHAALAKENRAEYFSVTDQEALDAFVYLSRQEGIIPAFETAHAIAGLRSLALSLVHNSVVIVNLSGRGDKDVLQAQTILGEEKL